jgi:hypothetical protein
MMMGAAITPTRVTTNRGNVIDEQARVVLAAPVLVFREDRHEGLGECPLGEQPSQQVGDPERDEKRVGGKARAECARDHHIANEAENARDERHAAHHRQGLEQIHLVVLSPQRSRRSLNRSPALIAPSRWPCKSPETSVS